MYPAIRFLGVAALLVASPAHSQSPQAALLNHIPPRDGHAESSHGAGRVEARPSLQVTGEQALMGRVEHSRRPTGPSNTTDAPIDGTRALLGRSLSTAPSSFVAELRGELVSSAAGDAEFGPIPDADRGSSGFTLSLGARGQGSAILFTHRSGAPFTVGRYRITDGGIAADGILALVMTGSPTSPTGVFRGRSGWLVVTAAADRALAGRFEIDGVGFLAAEPGDEDRYVNVTGSFSATAVGTFQADS